MLKGDDIGENVQNLIDEAPGQVGKEKKNQAVASGNSPPSSYLVCFGRELPRGEWGEWREWRERGERGERGGWSEGGQWGFRDK